MTETERRPAEDVDHSDADKAKKLAGADEGGEDMSPGERGEDEGSSEIEGEDGHLKDDQKSTPI